MNITQTLYCCNSLRNLCLVITIACSLLVKANNNHEAEEAWEKQQPLIQEEYKKWEKIGKNQRKQMESIQTSEDLRKYISTYPAATELVITNKEKLTDVSPIQKLRNLIFLKLKDCTAIRNIASLGKVTTLETLDLGGCKKLTNIIPLSGLIKLQVLNLSHTGIKSLRPLGSLTHLKELYVVNCPHLPQEEISKLQTTLPHLKIIAHR